MEFSPFYPNGRKTRLPDKSCFWLADSLKNLLLWNFFAKRQVSDTGSASWASSIINLFQNKGDCPRVETSKVYIHSHNEGSKTDDLTLNVSNLTVYVSKIIFILKLSNCLIKRKLDESVKKSIHPKTMIKGLYNLAIFEIHLKL